MRSHFLASTPLLQPSCSALSITLACKVTEIIMHLDTDYRLK
ncbi:hypothetical protein HMPREF0971_02438 [Segatella oris F0302]|uniref:Uncharacterized protein n=1 Tax=Segatella oris F0302 TaxID=649760 RepID=D1QTV7_9BACT|nr:hypothetical protein HMPREF0971_02438 [Segatella oris F0302]